MTLCFTGVSSVSYHFPESLGSLRSHENGKGVAEPPRMTPADPFFGSIAGDRTREIAPFAGSAQRADALGKGGRFVSGADQAVRGEVLQQLPQQGKTAG